MATGKLSYLNYSKQAVVFPDDTSAANTRILVLTNTSCADTFSTSDFAIEVMLNWDSTIANQGQVKTIMSKGDYSVALANKSGWILGLTPSTETLSIKLNDGSATAVTASFAGICPADTFNHFRFEIVRDTGVTLYKNGVFVSTNSAITARAGTVSNILDWHVGGEPGASNSWFKGLIHMIKIDQGYDGQTLDNEGTRYCLNLPIDYGSVWNKENYLKIAHFWPQKIDHYRAAWFFNNSLVDSSIDAYTWLAKDGNDPGNDVSVTYDDGPFGSIGYSWTYDPIPSGHEYGPIDLDNRLRSLDGTLKMYRGAQKSQKTLRFRTNDLEQIIALMGAYYQSSPIQIHDYDDQPRAFQGYFGSSPLITEIQRRGDPTDISSFSRIWEISTELIEI